MTGAASRSANDRGPTAFFWATALAATVICWP